MGVPFQKFGPIFDPGDGPESGPWFKTVLAFWQALEKKERAGRQE
jgi:hypothetical protein